MGRFADIIELFAGQARICRLAESAGYFTLAHDILYDKSGGFGKSCMDLNESAGFAPLGFDVSCVGFVHGRDRITGPALEFYGLGSIQVH